MVGAERYTGRAGGETDSEDFETIQRWKVTHCAYCKTLGGDVHCTFSNGPSLL